MKIIVNADDLGMSESVNCAIFEGMQRGVITSATLLSNGPAIAAAVRGLRHFPDCSFGVHLNLTEFRPVCRESQTRLASILDVDRCFNGNSIREVRVNAALLRAIFWEWCAQIENLIGMGVPPSHLDAHHHVHTIPQLLPVMAAMRRKYKINKVRISRNLYDESECPSQMLLLKKALFNSTLRVMGFHTTRLFTDLATFVKLCAARPPRHSSAELMTHPGALPRNRETSLLEGHWPGILSYRVNLVSYNSF